MVKKASGTDSTKKGSVKKTAAKKAVAEKKATPQQRATFPIVAIGASAGGYEAIAELLENLPPDLGMAYIILQHLSPSHESICPNYWRTKRI